MYEERCGRWLDLVNVEKRACMNAASVGGKAISVVPRAHNSEIGRASAIDDDEMSRIRDGINLARRKTCNSSPGDRCMQAASPAGVSAHY